MDLSIDFVREKKILIGHLARVQRRVSKLMKEQLSILKLMYKLDTKIDNLTWELSQKPEDELLKKEKENLDISLSKLLKRKYQNNDLLKKQDEKSKEYSKRLVEVQRQEALTTLNK